MRAALIRPDGYVETIIEADSLALVKRLEVFTPYDVIRHQKTDEWSVGWTRDAQGNFTARAAQPKPKNPNRSLFIRLPAAVRVAIRTAAKTDAEVDDALQTLRDSKEAEKGDQEPADAGALLISKGLAAAADISAMLA